MCLHYSKILLSFERFWLLLVCRADMSIGFEKMDLPSVTKTFGPTSSMTGLGVNTSTMMSYRTAILVRSQLPVVLFSWCTFFPLGRQRPTGTITILFATTSPEPLKYSPIVNGICPTWWMTGWNLNFTKSGLQGGKRTKPLLHGWKPNAYKGDKSKEINQAGSELKHFGMIPPGDLSCHYFAFRSSIARSTNQLNFVP